MLRIERNRNNSRELPEVMNLEETAVFLQLSVPTVKKYADSGEIPCRRVGRRYLFSRSALTKWLSYPDARIGLDSIGKNRDNPDARDFAGVDRIQEER